MQSGKWNIPHVMHSSLVHKSPFQRSPNRQWAKTPHTQDERVVPISVLSLVNSCVTGWNQKDVKIVMNVYLCYNSNQDACDRIHKFKRNTVQMFTPKLATLWSLHSHKTETDTFNCLFLEDMNHFLQISICFSNDHKACQIEIFSWIRWMPPLRQLVISHSGH